MPWDAKTFAARHNSKLKGRQATKAAKIATAMVERGVSDGEAIATANARAGEYYGAGKQSNRARVRTGKTRSWTGK